jgi:phosphopantetheine--protein transferase-like protein
MEEKIKSIITRYIKTPVEQINSSTVIDRSAVSGSILVHRMYANLASEGFVVENYWDVKNFGMLLQRLNGSGPSKTILVQEPENNFSNLSIAEADSIFNGIGIDIEEIGSMPTAIDFREDEFYKMNFNAAEIAYCILQPNVLASFAGLFAAKEAIVKADNSYQNKPFNTIFIDHLPNGKPVHTQFQLSISHTDTIAVAMAAVPRANSSSSQSLPANSFPAKNKTSQVAWIALLLSIISISILIYILITVYYYNSQ